jgi:TetR/AcrR family transcriptional regulator, transcriptional repressor for nem operon
VPHLLHMTKDTPTAILDTAERLVQQRGFNGFSYADVAAELGVTKAGLHYHFAGKAELGEALMNRYARRFGEALAAIDAGDQPAPEKLEAYADLYAGVLNDERMCLCGMLAAEYRTLPARMQTVVLRFFDENERWLEQVLEDGRRAGTISLAGSARDAARLIVSSLEGAMLVARPYADIERFRTAARSLLAGLSAKPS